MFHILHNIPHIEFLEDYNNTEHSSTRKTPLELLELSAEELKKESTKQFSAGKKRVGKNKFVAQLNVGDSVRIYDPKRKEINCASQNTEMQ